MDTRGSSGTVKCIDCGKPFQPREAFHKRCSDCQRKSQGSHAAGAQLGSPPPGRVFSRQLPAGYLTGGYFDEAGNLHPALLLDQAQELAKLFGQEGMASTQLRRFFTKVRFIEQGLDAGQTFAAARPRIAKLIPDAAYAVGRGVAPDLFKQFLERNVDLAMRDEPSFRKGFINHFESVVAFYGYVNKYFSPNT